MRRVRQLLQLYACFALFLLCLAVSGGRPTAALRWQVLMLYVLQAYCAVLVVMLGCLLALYDDADVRTVRPPPQPGCMAAVAAAAA